MNIFKVIASSKKSFPEECMSAIIAWLLNPHMEHGLGYEFLKRFIEKIERNNPQLDPLSIQLVNRLRTISDDTDADDIEVLCDLEYHVGGESNNNEAFIDVVLEINDTILAIENKIYANSASDPSQLVREYNGLKGMAEKKTIIMVFLVPYNSVLDALDLPVQKELDALSITDGSHDIVQLVTWQKNNCGFPSIYNLISELLTAEASGQIEPIPEYTRHTLKALNAFILNDFSGYYYEKKPANSGANRWTEDIADVPTLLEKDKGYVGVNHGVNGLLRMTQEKLNGSKFQYTTRSEIEGSRDWFKIDQFKKIVHWLQGDKVDDLDFSTTVDGETLIKIVSQCNNSRIYVGVKGGLGALHSMDANTIVQRNYQIAAMSQEKNAQWFSGKDFLSFVKGKSLV